MSSQTSYKDMGVYKKWEWIYLQTFEQVVFEVKADWLKEKLNVISLEWLIPVQQTANLIV